MANSEELISAKELTAKEVFDFMKDSKEHITLEDLRNNEKSLVLTSRNILKTGQKRLAKQVAFNLHAIQKEIALLTQFPEYNTYVNKDVLYNFMEKNKERTVIINYLSEYPREIPLDIAEKIEVLKENHVFDSFIIVYTDYTGEERSKVAEDEREKDPIIFGIYANPREKLIYDRYYFIADWEDEFCDLTMEKLIIEQRNMNPDVVVLHTAKLEELPDTKDVLKALEQLQSGKELVEENKPLTFKQKLKKFFHMD